MQRLLLFCLFLAPAVSVRAQLTLATALEAPDLAWTTGGSASWTPQTTQTHDGVDAAQSGATPLDLQESWVQTTVIGPGNLSFWWKVSSETGFDYLQFTVDGVVVGTPISGEVNWQQSSNNLSPGSHTLRWRYFKDGSVTAGQDRGWLDEVMFVPETGPARIHFQPESQLAYEGANARFVVTASGTQPLEYRWYDEGTNALEGATGATLLLTNVQPAQAGGYFVIVSNSLGSATSTVATLTLVPPPTQIVNGSFETGDFSGWQTRDLPNPFLVLGVRTNGFSPGYGLFTNAASDGLFSVSHGFDGVGPGTIRIFQELRIPANAPVLNLDYRAGWDMLNFGGSTQPRLFNVIVEPAGGGTPMSNTTLLTAAPGTQNLDSGLGLESLDLSAVTGRTVRITFEWVVPENFTGPGHFQLDNVYLAGAAEAPVIVSPPADLLAGQGQSAGFSVTARGTRPLTYRWYYNETNEIAGATERALSLPDVQPVQAGLYHVVIRNLFGSATSQVARLTVFGLAEALDATELAWTAGGDLPWLPQTEASHDGVDAAGSGSIADAQQSWLETTLTGPGTLSFWWKVSSELNFDYLRLHMDGVLREEISGEVDWEQRSLSIPEGVHTVRWRYVKDFNILDGQDQAWVDEVTFVPSTGAPVIVRPPASQTLWEGANLTLSVVALGGPPLGYRWYFNQTNLLPEAGSTLYVPNLLATGLGSYHVVVSNAFNAVTSNPAVITFGTNGPAASVLLFVDSPVPSPFETALRNLGQPHQRFTDVTSFLSAVDAANPATTLVILDQPWNGYDFSSVINFINGGGRALVQSFSLVGNPTFQAALRVSLVARDLYPMPVHDWGESPLFSGLPIALDRVDIFPVPEAEDTFRLEPLEGGVALAGHTEPAPSEAAVVVGNSGRTIVNGFWPAGITPTAHAVRFAENEILLLTGPASVTAPVIRASPRSQTVQLGSSASLRVTAWGGIQMSYRWFFNETNELPELSDTLTLPSAQLADSGGYRVIASNAYGSATSQVAVLTVSAVIPVTRALLLVDPSSPVFSPYASALASNGLPYELFLDELTFEAALASASTADTLAVVDAPWNSHTFEGVRQFVLSGGRTILTYWNLQGATSLAGAFEATVISPLSVPQPVYNWGGSALFNGVTSPLQFTDILTYNGQTLQPQGTAQAPAGFVTTPTANQAAAVLGNQGRTLLKGFLLGEMISSTAAVRFAQNEIDMVTPRPPIILTQPTNRAVILGNATTFIVNAQGSPVLRYQWHHNGTMLGGATNASYTVPSVQSNHLGAYSVVITNRYGAVTSQLARLDGSVPIAFVQPPISLSVVTGAVATFSVEITGDPPPFEYEWRRTTNPRFTNRFVLNERRSFFTIPSAQTNHTGNYAVVVRGASTQFGVNRTFSLTLLADGDLDGLPDIWEATYPLAGNPNQDTDADGATNLEEYGAGTDPTDPNSVLRIQRLTVGSGATIEFLAMSNRTYAVEYSDDLGGGWSMLADLLARTTNRTEIIVDPVTTSNRTYRLVTPRPQ